LGVDARERFPLTLAYLGRLPPGSTPTEIVERVCAEHDRGDIPSRAVRDLVRYEALLLDLPPAAIPSGAPPHDEDRCVLAPHVRVLDFGAALPEIVAALREGKAAKARPARGWLVLWRGGERLLYRETGWLLQSFREPARVGDVVEDDEDRALVAEWWRLGLLARA
jgi:hypothetical protein